MKKKWTAILLTAALGLGLAGAAGVRAPLRVDAAQDLALYVGSPLVLSGETVKPLDSQNYAVTPIIQNDRTLVPLRAIFEAMGATVDWNSGTQTVTAVRNGVTVKLTVGSTVMSRNWDELPMDTAPVVLGGRTLVPARAVAEAFGADVGWDEATHTVTISEAAAQ